METFDPIVPSLDRNPYWQEVNKQLGVNLKMSVVPAGDYANKFATVVAGGDLPDFLQIVGTPAGLTQLLEAKCQDLTPYLSGDAVKEYPFLANLAEYFWTTSCIFDGKIWGVPVPRYRMVDPLFRRDDLIAEAGVDPNVADWAGFVDLCKELTDPSKNRWAISDAESALQFAQQCLGVSNQWKNDGGTLTSFYEEEGTKQALDAVA